MKIQTPMLLAAALALPCAALSETEFLNLPAGYRQLEFIQSSGIQYIDTGIVPGSTTLWNADFQFVSFPPVDDFAGYCGWYGETEEDESFRFGVEANYDDDDGSFYFAVCVNNGDIPVHADALADFGRHTVELGSGSQTYDNLQIGNGSILSTATEGQTLFLFAVHDEAAGGAGFPLSMKLFSSQIHNAGDLVRDFVPCVRTNDNAVGLYDRVTDTFFGNDGDGAFVAGNLVLHPEPIATFGLATASNIVATFTGSIQYCGDDTESCGVYVAYAPEGEPLGKPVCIGTDLGLGEFTLTLPGLYENTSYAYSVFASNTVAASKPASGVFYTKTNMEALSSPIYYRGLQQAKFAMNVAWTNEFENSTIPLEIVPGPLMADVYAANVNEGKANPATNPYTGHQFAWNSDNSTFAYRGEVHLAANQTITFGKYFDDSARICVTDPDGTVKVVLNHTSYNSFGKGSYTATADGWYPIDIRVADQTGGKGPWSGSPWGKTMGLGYNLIGQTTDTPLAAWKHLLDPGDTSFFRYVETNNSFMAVSTPRVSGSTVYSTFEFEGVPVPAKLRAYYGVADFGETTIGWDGYVEAAEINMGYTAAKSYAFPGLADHLYSRFCLIVDAPDHVGFQQFGPALHFDQAGPSIGLSSDASSYPDTFITVKPADFGTGATSLTNLVLEVSETEDFSVIVTNCVLETPITGKDDIRVALQLLSDRGYFARVHAANDLGVETTSAVLAFRSSFATAAMVGLTSVHEGPTYAILRWTVSDYGAPYSDSASLAVEWSTSADFANYKTGATVLDVSGKAPLSNQVMIKGIPSASTVYFRLRAVNSAGTTILTEPISVATLLETTDRVWANEGDGDMTLGESYLEGIPPDAKSTIRFLDPPIVQPVLPTNMTVKALYFGPFGTDSLPDLDGYVMSSLDGAELTLSAVASDWALNSRATGTIQLDLPIQLSGSKVNFGGSCANIVLTQPIRTSGTYTQDVNTQTDGTDAQHCGSLTFAAANPNFKPKQIHCGSASDLRLAHPEAFVSVTNIVSGQWGGTQLPRIWNLTDGPIVLDNLRGFTPESFGLNGFFFNGNPFIMTNCQYGVSPRESKSRSFNAAVTVRCIYAPDSSGCDFNKAGTNMLETLEDRVEAAGIVNHTRVSDGMYYPHHLYGDGIRPERKLRLNGDGGGYPTLGLDEDIRLPMENLGGVSFGKDDEQKAGGFSGMGGDVHITLVDAFDNAYSLTNGTKTPSGTGYVTPSPWVFGNVSATGTAILENDVNFAGSRDIWAFQGTADVAGRFAGDVRSHTSSLTGYYYVAKRGPGAIAFDKSLEVSKCEVDAGGIYLNCVLTNADVSIENTGYIGGTGTVSNVKVKKGGAFRAGESTVGELKVWDVNMEDGSRLLVDVGRNKAGCLRFVDPTKYFVANGTITVTPKFYPTAAIQGRVKIIDWCEVQDAAKKSLVDRSVYQLDCNPDEVVAAGLSADEEGLYLSYRRRRDPELRTLLMFH